MKISKEVLDKWKLLREHGDIATLVEEADSNKVTVSKALNKGICNENLFKKISAFYNRRAQLLEEAK